jgi:hypothetical protein
MAHPQTIAEDSSQTINLPPLEWTHSQHQLVPQDQTIGEDLLREINMELQVVVNKVEVHHLQRQETETSTTLTKSSVRYIEIDIY